MKTEKFEILSARNHTRARPGMYLGSTSNEQVPRFVLGKWKTVSYVPAILKMVDEILDNAIDEAIRTNFKYANDVNVNVQKYKVTITDNGRGIPLDQIEDTETGETILRPVAAWTKVRAGTNFDDDRVTIGANGVGAACVNFMSKLFIGKTWNKGKQVEIRCTNGAEDTMVIKSAASKVPTKSGTSVEFRPDFSLFGVKNFEEGDHLDLIHDRLNSLQIAFPEIKFKLNGKLVKAVNIKQYAELFAGDGASYVSNSRNNLVFIITSSQDGFRQNGYINGVNTRLGGAYNDFVIIGITDELQRLIKRKYKVEINRSTIKGGLTFILFARNFVDPQYDAQTKERLTSSQSAVREHYANSGALTFEQVAKKIMACDDIIEPIVEAQVAKKIAADKRAATLAQKKLRRVKVQKHVAATGMNATLFLCEGDCIHEDTYIHTNEGRKLIKEIDVGDLVMTHAHRYKPVVSKNYTIKDGIKINGTIYSPNHRLYVYDTIQNEFKFLECNNINQNTHKLVCNRLIAHGIENAIHEITDIKRNNTVITDKIKLQFSNTHKVIKIIGMSLTTVDAAELLVGDLIIL